MFKGFKACDPQGQMLGPKLKYLETFNLVHEKRCNVLMIKDPNSLFLTQKIYYLPLNKAKIISPWFPSIRNDLLILADLSYILAHHSWF